jgi:hypothetical protein
VKYCFDIDGTICTNTNGDYENATPIENRVNLINDLYEKENEIILFTARGSTTNIDWKELTEQLLHTWGIKYHKLLFGKPEADIFVDDKAISDILFFKDL